MTLLKTGKGRNIGEGNRLKEYDGIEYTHDPLGNLIYRELPNGEKQYFQYDTENQLTRAEIKKPQGNTEIWEYAYDPFGRRLSKERKDKLAWVSTAPKRTHFVWDGSRLLQEYTYKGHYTYIYTDQDSYEPLAQVFYNLKDDKQYLSYYHTDQIGMPREQTDQYGNLLWFGDYTAWGCLKSETKVYQNAHQPFRLQNQYFDAETGLHYNFLRYYEPDTGRFINQDPIGLLGGDNLYQFAPNANGWVDPLGLHPVVVIGVAIIAAVSRRQALQIARRHAQVPRLSRTNAGGKPMSEKIPLEHLNPSSRGKNWNELKRNNSDLGRRSTCGRCKYEDHPDGHNDDHADHHRLPHVHSVNRKGEEIIVTYSRRKR